MKKLLVIVSAMALALALVACGQSGTLGVESDGTGVHVKATGVADGSATGNMRVGLGEGIAINQSVDKGSFTVTIKDSAGKEVYTGEFNARVMQQVDVEPGAYDLTITAKKATGTLDIIPVDKGTQAEAAGTLDDALSSATGKTAEELGVDPQVGMANPWSEVATAEEAATGAGVGSFSVIEGLTLSFGKVGDWNYQYMKGMAQASAPIGDNRIMVRKGIILDGETDISGYHGTYPYTWEQNIKGLVVSCSGNARDAAEKVTWTVEDKAYAIVSGSALTPDDINSLINGIQ